jgi:nitroreductase
VHDDLPEYGQYLTTENQAMEVAEAIRTKRAIRRFSTEPIPDEIVRYILRAGTRAQSSKNSQPWRFIAIRKRETLVSLAALGTSADHFATAALGVAFLTVDPLLRWSIMFDAGQAASYMQLAAWEHNVGSCLATIYQSDVSRELLGYPEDYHLNVALAFGYPADPEELTRPPRSGGRRAFEDSVYFEYWAV